MLISGRGCVNSRVLVSHRSAQTDRPARRRLFAPLQWGVRGPDRMWHNSSLGFGTASSWQRLAVLHLNLKSLKCSPGIWLGVPAANLHWCGFLKGKLWLNLYNVCDMIPWVAIITVKSVQPWKVGVVVRCEMFSRDWGDTWVEEPRSDGTKCMNYSSSVGVRSSEQQRLLCAAILGPAEGPRE